MVLCYCWLFCLPINRGGAKVCCELVEASDLLPMCPFWGRFSRKNGGRLAPVADLASACLRHTQVRNTWIVHKNHSTDSADS